MAMTTEVVTKLLEVNPLLEAQSYKEQLMLGLPKVP